MRVDSSLITPIYVKQSDDTPLPQDPVYYLLASDNLYLCRNHGFYQSCVPAPRWPTELAPHAPALKLTCPQIPQPAFEEICGFFGRVSETYGAEAIVLLAWDEQQEQIRTIVPPQVSAVGNPTWGPSYPICVKYQFPRGLPAHWKVFADIHSHCDLAAYASQTDIDDEHTFAGLHIVVGRLNREPPEFHVEGVVDGARFPLTLAEVVVGYEQRRDFPKEWLDQMVVTNFAMYRTFDFETQHPAAASSVPSQKQNNDVHACEQENPSHDANDDHTSSRQGQATDASARP